MPVQVPVTQTGLEASIEAAAKRAGKRLQINMGAGAKSIEGLSQPLGRITGKADQFTKSMEAANARVLAFGASVGVLSAVQRGFASLVKTTIDVEKSLKSINSILGTNAAALDKFKKTIFNVARDTETSFQVVAEAALELSRQGLKAEQVTKRLSDSLILSRLSGLGASEAVAGLTAAINSFNSTGITSAEVLNKLSAAAVSAAVSERDLIEGIKRSGAVAIQAGVSLDELVGVITAVQEKTARGGAVIGNSFKTIFTRIQSLDKLQTMQNLGMEITDLSGNVLSGTKLIQNLAQALSDVPDARRLQIAENLVGKFQIAPFLAILDDYNSKTSRAIEVTEVSGKATNEAYQRNIALNEALSAVLNKTVVSVQELANTLGEIGVTSNLKGILNFFSNLVGGVQEILDGDGIGSKFAKGLVKGIGNIISGPGLAIFGAIIIKLTADLAKFGVGSLKTFFGLNKAAKDQATLQGQIASTLLNNSGIQKQILAIENSQLSTEQKKAAQTKFFTTALKEQEAIMLRMQTIAGRVTPGVFAGTRGRGRAAGGFIPNYNAVLGYGSEQSDINRGVGGAPSSAKPVTIPNFNFGGGKRGTMVANTSEYMVPNFAGTGGSAIFNQNMISAMGLPAGARKIGAAGGYIPNFAMFGGTGTQTNPFYDDRFGMLIPQKFSGKRTQQGRANNGKHYKYNVFGVQPKSAKAKETEELKGMLTKYALNKANEEALLLTGGRPRAEKEKKLANLGGVGSLAGTIFETAVSGILKSKEFDLGQTASFDFIGRNTVKQISEISPSLKLFEALAFLEAKIRDNDYDIRKSMANKLSRFMFATGPKQSLPREAGLELRGAVKEKGASSFKRTREDVERAIGFGVSRRGIKGSARGYIPSFASPLQDAIARESAAGLPINQIRINQDASLRNSGNPLGLAVTNTRDEPTGAIPNFARRESAERVGDEFGGLVGKMLALQIGFSALTGILGEVTNQNKALATGLTALNVVISASLAAQAFGGFKNIGFAALGGGRLGAAGQNLLSAGRQNIKIGSLRQGMIGGLEGRGQIAGGMLQKGAGRAAGMVGPIVAGTALAVGVGMAINKIGGVTDAVADSLEKVGKASDKAATNLLSINVTEDQREAFVESREGAGKEIATAFMKGTLTTGLFSDQKELDNLAKSIDTALKRGATEGEIDQFLKAIKDTAGQDNPFNFKIGEGGTAPRILGGQGTTTIDSKELAKQTQLLAKLGVNLQMKFAEIDSRLTDEERKEIAAGVPTALKDLAKKENLSMGAVNLFSQEVQGGIKNKRLEAEKRIDQMRADIGKNRLLTEINITKIKAEAITEDEKALGLAKATNSLSDQGILALEQKIALNKEDVKTNSKIADVLGKEISGIEKLTLDKNQQLELQSKLNRLNLDQLSSDEKIQEVLKDVLTLEQATSGEADAITDAVKNTAKGLRDENAARKQNIRLAMAQKILEADRARIIRDLVSDLSREERLERATSDFGFDLRSNAIETARALSSGNPALTDRQKARNELGFTRAEGNLRVERTEAEAVAETKKEIIELAKVLKGDAKGAVENLLTILKTGGVSGVKRAIGTVTTMAAGALDTDNKNALQDLAANVEIRDKNIKLAKVEGITNNAIAANTLKNIGALKSYSQLLEEFTNSLLQQAQQLKVDLIGTRDGGGIISNINEQLFALTANRAGGSAGGIANAATAAALTSLEDQATLAGTSKEARSFRRQSSILKEQLDLKAQFVALQTDENAKEEDLLALKQKILILEKQRLNVNDSLANMLEDEFSFTQEEINRSLNESLVQNARNFVDTISDGLVDAIAKGEDLGDTLKKAAASFLLDQARSNMSAAFQSIGSVLFKNSGGAVTGGSGTRDDVPALLTGGEFVMRKGAVKKYGSGFMSALNAGQVPTMNRGGLFTPGSYGQGAITGKRNLLDFATQGYTTGGFDSMAGGAGFASIALAPQSAALTMFGRRNSPQFAQEQASKNRAFSLYSRQIEREQEMKEKEKEANRALLGSALAFGVSFGLQGLFSGMGKKSAAGGAIPYTAGVDTVPAMLSGGEFVMNAAATQRIGRGNLANINSGGGSGGNGAVIGKLDELISVSDNQGETVINITVNSDGTESERGNGNENENNLAFKIRDVVKQVIDDEKRLGGSLRQARA